MSKIIVIGDCHIGEYPSNPKIEEEIDFAFEQVHKYVSENDIAEKFSVGDIIRNANKVSVNTLHRISKYLINTWCISGNHDQQDDNFYDNKVVNIIDAFDLPNLAKHDCIIYDKRYNPTISVLGVSFYRNSEDFYKALAQRIYNQSGDCDGTKQILLIHQTPNTTPFSENASDTIDINHPFFDKFDLVICGHIHEHKQLSDKFWQIGGLVPFNRNEVGQKYFLEIDTETLEVKPIPLKQKISFSERKKIEKNPTLSKKVTEKAKEFDLKDATEHYAKDNEFTEFETQKALETIKKAR